MLKLVSSSDPSLDYQRIAKIAAAERELATASEAWRDAQIAASSSSVTLARIALAKTLEEAQSLAASEIGGQARDIEAAFEALQAANRRMGEVCR